MSESQGGRIKNVDSGAGRVREPMRNYDYYDDLDDDDDYDDYDNDGDYADYDYHDGYD